MLAPLRDYFSPHDPESSPPLCATKDRYFIRLSVVVHPNRPGFKEARWIASENTNVEHLPDVFTSIDTASSDVWEVYISFMEHLYWHKPHEIVLGVKIKNLPDHHRPKPGCSFRLSGLFELVGNDAERKQLLTRTLVPTRERGDDSKVALMLRHLSNANRLLGFLKEGVQQAKEASEICGRLDSTVQMTPHSTRSISSRKKALNERLVCQPHLLLGQICHTSGCCVLEPTLSIPNLSLYLHCTAFSLSLSWTRDR